MKNIWKNKKVLVTGSEGMIGRELVLQLKELGAEVYEFDWRNDPIQNVMIIRYCELELEKIKPEYVFNLFGIKGNPKMTKEKPVDFMGPMLQGDTNMIISAQKCEVKHFLYTSSIAVEYPESDWFPAWAKRTGEELIKAMHIQYPKGTKYTIVRPSNVYGRFDNFDNPNAMVVTSLINQALKNKKIVLDKKGSQQIRDIINAKDVARGMLEIYENGKESRDCEAFNLCSSKGVSIKQIASIIAEELNIPIEYKDLNLILGPNRKVMDINWNFLPHYTIQEGIKEVINYIKKKP